MKTNKTIGVLVVLAVLGSAASAQGLSLWDDRVKFNGYVKTQFGIWLQDQSRYGMSANDLNMARGTLQLETEIQLHERAQVFCIFRGVREAAYEAEVNVPDDFYDEEDVRELYLDVDVTDKFHVRIGRQQVVWGEADYLRILDIINPLDLSWHFVLEPWEDIRIPNYMIRAFYRVPSFLRSSFEVVWVPGWDEREDRVTRLPPATPAAGRWSPHPTNIPMVTIPGLTINQIINNNLPERTLEEGNIGGRWEAMIGDFQFALAYYYTLAYDPVLVLGPSPDLTDPAVLLDVLLNGLDVEVDLEYPRIHIAGASCNYYWDWPGVVFRGEFAYYVDQPYNAFEVVESMGMTTVNYFTMEKSDVVKYMIGLDRPTMIRWLNKYSALTLTGQFVQTILLDHKDNFVTTGYASPIDEIQTQIAVGAMTNYLHGKLWPTVGGAYDFTGAWLLQTSLEYKPTDHIRINLKSNHLWGQSNFDSFGLFDHKDEAILELIYLW